MSRISNMFTGADWRTYILLTWMFIQAVLGFSLLYITPGTTTFVVVSTAASILPWCILAFVVLSSRK